MAGELRPCDAPSTVIIEEEKHMQAMEISPGREATFQHMPRSQRTDDGSSISDKYLSDGFEGRNRLYTTALQFFAGTAVLMIVIYDGTNVAEVGGALSGSKVQLGLEDEIGDIMQFIGIGIFTFVALAPNLIIHYTQRRCRRLTVVVAAGVSLLAVQISSNLAAGASNSLVKNGTVAAIVVLATYAIAVIAADILYLYLFSSVCCCCSCPCCCKGNEEVVLDADEQCWSVSESMQLLWEGIKAAAVHYSGLIATGFVFAWHTIGGLWRLPQWIWDMLAWLRGAAVLRWESVREDESYRHSVWMISALGVSGISIIFFSLTIPVEWMQLVDKYERFRNCIADRNGVVQDLLLGAGFGNRTYYYSQIFPGGTANSTAMETFYQQLADGTNPPSFRVFEDCAWPRYVDEVYSVVESRLNSSAQSTSDVRDPMHDFENSVTGKLVLYLDAALLKSAFTVWIGFAAAAIVGVNSLLSALSRYKCLTQMLVQALPSKLPKGRQKLLWGSVDKSLHSRSSLSTRQTQCKTWEELTDAYSLSSASLFLGVWVSTAVFQLVLIGGLATWILASLMAWRQLWALLEGLVPLLVVYLILLLVDWVVGVSGPLLNRAVFEDHQLKRPVLWAFYTLIRSLIGLAVGLLFAVWRLLLLMIMTFLNFNRLDKVVLPPRWDQGHRSLFSMAMMNAMLQKDETSGVFRSRDKDVGNETIVEEEQESNNGPALEGCCSNTRS